MHIGQVILGNQPRHTQIDFRPTAKRLIQVRLLALADRLHRALEHFHIKGKAHCLDLPALAFAQQLACAADFQVVGRQHEARTQILRVGNRFQTLLGVGRDLFARRRQQVGVRLVVTASDPPA